MPPAKRTLLALCGAPAGALIATLGVWKYHADQQHWRDWPHTSAVVVALEYERSSGGRGEGVYRPVFEFAAPDGRPVRARHGTGANPPSYRVGQRAEIAVDPADPGRFATHERSVLLLAALGALFAAACLVAAGASALRGLRQSKPAR